MRFRVREDCLSDGAVDVNLRLNRSGGMSPHSFSSLSEGQAVEFKLEGSGQTFFVERLGPEIQSPPK